LRVSNRSAESFAIYELVASDAIAIAIAAIESGFRKRPSAFARAIESEPLSKRTDTRIERSIVRRMRPFRTDGVIALEENHTAVMSHR